MEKKIFNNLLLVSDVDGTLTELTEIPKRNIEAIDRFISLGGHFTLCTGRPKCALGQILSQVKVNAPIITINGGYIYSHRTGQPLYAAKLPPQIKEFVFMLLENFEQIGAMLVEPDNYYVIRWGDESIEGVALRRDMYTKEGCCKSYAEEQSCGEWHKVVLIIPPEQIPSVRSFIEEKNPEGFYPVQSDEFYLELVPNGVDKGKAVEFIKDELHLGETAAIGDRENDKPMLSKANFSAIPLNGDENLKKEVDFIVDSCENGAVADFISRLEEIFHKNI